MQTVSLDHLEQDVLARIARHRQGHDSRGSLPVGVVLTVCALVAGVSVGALRSHHGALRGSETVVLADDASLAPSTLLTNTR